MARREFEKSIAVLYGRFNHLLAQMIGFRSLSTGPVAQRLLPVEKFHWMKFVSAGPFFDATRGWRVLVIAKLNGSQLKANLDLLRF